MYLHDCDEYYTVFHGSTGQPATVKVVVKMPENYPVDLYYLMDLSGSMVEDLKKFPALGESIGLQQLIDFMCTAVLICHQHTCSIITG